MEVCGTAAAALRATDAGIDLAIVDVRLPDLTGVRLVPQLRTRMPDGEVILMTGDDSLDTAIAAVREGVFAYVQKPFAPHDLLALAARALAQVQLRRERTRLAVELAVLSGFAVVLLAGAALVAACSSSTTTPRSSPNFFARVIAAPLLAAAGRMSRSRRLE